MLFERIVCGVDRSPESLEAARQAERLLAPGGHLLIVGAADVGIAVHAGWAATSVVDEIEAEERRAVVEARAQVIDGGRVETRMLKGDPISCLLATAREEKSTLVAVGTHGLGRAKGILLGSVATAMLHDAPGSVLVARRPQDPEIFPRSILVGHDGSSQARAAAEVGAELAHRFGAGVRTVVASGGKPVDVDGLRDVQGLEWDERKPVEALVAASREADVAIVGSRGLHGLAALGSVSERVAHEAARSVLVVRKGRR